MRKRLFDVGFSLFFLLLFLPVGLLIAALIKLTSPGPIFFKQLRVGKNEKPYYMYKFRSMVLHDATPEQIGPVKHSHSLVTPIGYLLRRYKLDELPQFINVFRGEMSLIGPRPCLFSRLATLSPREKRRFNMLPGISGWAEVNGNVELSWEEQLLLDLWYVDHYTSSLDRVIFWKTLKTVFGGPTKNTAALQEAERYKNECSRHSATP